MPVIVVVNSGANSSLVDYFIAYERLGISLKLKLRYTLDSSKIP